MIHLIFQFGTFFVALIYLSAMFTAAIIMQRIAAIVTVAVFRETTTIRGIFRRLFQ